MNIRDYAENFKQVNGIVLAVYEMFKDQVNPQALITEYVNALPNTVLNQFGAVFQNTAQISATVLALGVVLAKDFPVVVR
jgi:hypothetical protein